MLSLIVAILVTLASFFLWFMTLLSDPCNTQDCKDAANWFLKIGLPLAGLFYAGWWFGW